MTTTLITGGRGVIGTALARELRARGHEVWISDLGVWHADNYIEMDVRSFYQVERALERVNPDYVYHMAAVVGRWHGEDFYDSLWTANVVGTENILKMQERLGFRQVFFSSSEVYGDYAGEMTEDLTERVELRQVNAYGLSKWVGEQLCMKSADMHGSETVRIRPLNAYGPGEYYSPYRSAVCRFVYYGLMNTPFTVYTGHRRIFTYIDDITRTLANVTDNFQPGECYNVGGHYPAMEHDMKQAAEIVLGALGRSPDLVTYKDIDPHTVLHKRVISEKAERDLGHRCETDLQTGLLKTIEWQRAVYKDQLMPAEVVR